MALQVDIYNELVNTIEMSNIELINLECRQFKVNGNGLAGVNINFDMEEVLRSGQKVNIPAIFKVTSSDNETKEVIFEINFQYLLCYELPLDKNFDDEYFMEFAKVNAPINVWPYARELVSTLTSRMGFPSLFIPLYK